MIIGALTSGALVESTSMEFLLALPAIVVTAVFFVIWFGIEDAPGDATGGYDWGGLALVTVAIGLVWAAWSRVRVLRARQPVLPWLLDRPRHRGVRPVRPLRARASRTR